MLTLFVIIATVLLTACSSDPVVYAPVTDVTTIETIPKNGLYYVRRDDSLYSIAWRYGLDYRYLAKRNQIPAPYAIHTGQIIYLHSQAPTVVVRKPIYSYSLPNRVEREPIATVNTWLRPTQGRIIGEFSGMNKGINIGGHIGDPIKASAAGKVVYSGNGLRAYGNLIIIKHNSAMLSAYAHNSRTLVNEGDWVSAGQKIAEMGSIGTQRPMLHFEIRKNGQPVNPLIYLSN